MVVSEQLTSTYRFGEKVVISNVDLLRSEIESIISAEDVNRIIFDLENLRVCDTYGVQFFLQCRRSAEKANKELLLYRPGTLFRELLKNAGLIHVFTIVEVLEDQE